MKPTIPHSFATTIRRAWAALHRHARALLVRGQRLALAGAPQDDDPDDGVYHEHHHLLGRRPRVLRRFAIGAAVLIGIVSIPIVALSWR
ncbi:MAG TPA: hypothetical protein VK281_04295, partial [Xanthobacteraceae bacterium]|nr:hypothetical protein [Xanthobacteraceae bacterium]